MNIVELWKNSIKVEDYAVALIFKGIFMVWLSVLICRSILYSVFLEF